MERFKFGQPPMRGSFSLVYIVVVGGRATPNLITDSTDRWFRWFLFGWGTALAAHDIALLIRSFRAGG